MYRMSSPEPQTTSTLLRSLPRQEAASCGDIREIGSDCWLWNHTKVKKAQIHTLPQTPHTGWWTTDKVHHDRSHKILFHLPTSLGSALNCLWVCLPTFCPQIFWGSNMAFRVWSAMTSSNLELSWFFLTFCLCFLLGYPPFQVFTVWDVIVHIEFLMLLAFLLHWAIWSLTLYFPCPYTLFSPLGPSAILFTACLFLLSSHYGNNSHPPFCMPIHFSHPN